MRANSKESPSATSGRPPRSPRGGGDHLPRTDTDSLDVPPAPWTYRPSQPSAWTPPTSSAPTTTRRHARGAEFAARIGVEPRMVTGGHMAPLNRPQEIASALRALLDDGI
ncbi:hypothetical protein [Streptomyces sp. TS71-3]|uniref:hypothetical protein n=1 Tax=Streptomyces sp. TS71-3 TaxID=2733862 RepID=UPI001B2F3F84|nr:hypothetical protein [Streptomyces sp. TS71-3]GHJ37540.1 hypothetical protein Sm713_31490 [Streptomyces sp. TS71-3]